MPGCVTEDTQQASYDVSAQISYRSNGAVAPECVNMYKVSARGLRGGRGGREDGVVAGRGGMPENTADARRGWLVEQGH